MGRYLKNTQIGSEYAVQIPSGPTSLRPTVPMNGQIRFNTDLNRFEGYYGGWNQIAKIGNVTITKDSFTGDGSTASFSLSKTPVNENSIIVFVGNVHQNPLDAYTLTGNFIVFATAPPLGQTVVVFHDFGSTDAS